MKPAPSDTVFGLLPPFYESPLYSSVHPYLKRIQNEFDIKISSYRYLKSAFDHDVFIVNKNFVFRFPRTIKGQKNLEYEIRLLKELQKQVAVAIPIYSLVAKDFSGYKLISGQILTTSGFKSLSKVNRFKVASQLIEFINVFHKLHVSEFVKFQPKLPENFVDIEERVEIELKKKLFPRLAKVEVEQIQNFYRNSKEILKKEHSLCPIHGDLYSYNVIWDKQNNSLGVIDFSDCQIGDPANDFEVFYDYGEEYADFAFNNYEGEKDELFLKRAEIYYKLHSIYTLLSSLLGAQISFDFAYRRFKERFKSNLFARL